MAKKVKKKKTACAGIKVGGFYRLLNFQGMLKLEILMQRYGCG
jgi:hypothetical protein